MVGVAALLALVVSFGIAPVVSANGGQVIKEGKFGAYNAIISATPWPANPGNLHLSMVLTRADAPDPVSNATVIFSNEMPGMAMPDAKPVRAFQGSRPNIYDVDIPLSMDGDWQVNVQIIGALGQADIPLTLKVEKPTPPWGLIIGLLVGLPMLAAGSWFFLFRKSDDEDDEDAPAPAPQV